MKSVLTAEAAELFLLEPVRVILLVFLGVIIALLALGANQCDLDTGIISHVCGTSNFFIWTARRSVYLPPVRALSALRDARQKNSAHRGRMIIACPQEFVKSFL